MRLIKDGHLWEEGTLLGLFLGLVSFLEKESLQSLEGRLCTPGCYVLRTYPRKGAGVLAVHRVLVILFSVWHIIPSLPVLETSILESL